MKSLDASLGMRLVAEAETAVARALGLDAPDLPVPGARLREPGASFVTLTRKGLLRGCIGSLEAVEPLIDNVRRNAVNAALHDSRFPPLGPEEYPDTDFEVSVLGPPEPLEHEGGQGLLAALRPGKDGLIIRAPGGQQATFLPQVWEQLPEPAAFLGHLCRKAGLPERAWEEGGLRVWRYTVEHFHGGARRS